MKTYNSITFSILILIVIPLSITAQNLALHKSYSLSTLPNYQYSAPASDKSSLTDGIYTKGYFWSQPTTVGWMGRSVSIDIDLGEILPVGYVTFNTVRYTKGGVNFPENIYVFISDDNRYFQYVGDAANSPDNTPGPYEVKKFILNEINASARYIIFSVVPKGKLLFCDEIQVFKGKSINIGKSSLIERDILVKTIDSLKSLEFERMSLEKSVSNLNDTMGRIKEIRDYADISDKLRTGNLSKSVLQSYQKKVQELHASALRSRFSVPFIMEKYNPWDSLRQFHNPTENTFGMDYHFTVPLNGVQYGSFVVTNSSATPQEFSFNIINDDLINNIEIFEVAYVPSLNYTRIPDPLIAVENPITIDPGISQMFIFKIAGIKVGSARSSIKVHSASGDMDINIDLQVQSLFPSPSLINANVWAYLNYPMLQDRKAEAEKDLELHHINTIVIPPAVLPKLGTSDYTAFINYIRIFKGIKKFLLFMNYSDARLRNGNGQFMTTAWKNKFLEWYNNIVEVMKQNGFSDTQIFLYPYDEIGGSNINDFKDLINWAKAAVPGIKFYATLANDAAINKILPLVDIAQIQSTYKKLLFLPPHRCEVWIYSGSGPSRSLSPYGFYRLMAWQAFANDFKGIGFWNYADEGQNKKLNLITDPLTTPSNSYSVIYDGPQKKIISSRRWEAFRLGIEDYSILEAYAKKYGLKTAKVLAAKVVSNPSDLNLADKVRDDMITQMSD